MRIRGSSIPATVSGSLSHPSSSSASFPSCESSSSSSISNQSRCEGLDLLAEAILHVAGALVCNAPFAQRKVVRRGKRALRFEKAIEGGSGGDQQVEVEEKETVIEGVSKPKRRKRVMALPSKYQDSVLQPWKRSTRQRRSLDIEG